MRVNYNNEFETIILLMHNLRIQDGVSNFASPPTDQKAIFIILHISFPHQLYFYGMHGKSCVSKLSKCISSECMEIAVYC